MMYRTFFQYLIVDIIAIMFMYNADKCKTMKNRKIYIIISAFILLIQLIFRDYSVGADYKAYIELYLSVYYGNITSAWTGQTWINLCKVFSLVFKDNFLIFFAFISIITVTFFYKAIMFKNKYAFIGVALYLAFCLYYQSFNQFRQILAVAIVLYSWKYIWLKNKYLYFLWICVAASIHASALIMIPIYFIANWDINFKHIMIYIISLVILLYGFDNILGLLRDTSYGSSYIGSSYDSTFQSSAIMNTIVRCIMLVMCMIFKNDVLKNDDNSKSLYNLIILCTIIQVLALFSHLFARVSTYFFAFYVLLIPRVMEVILQKVKEKWIIYILFFAVLIIYHSVYFFSTAESYGYDIYKFLVK